MARLDRRTIVVTRAEEGPDALCERLQELGAAVRLLPAIALAPPADPGPLAAALRGLSRFEWVAFTSAAAVDRVLDALAAAGLPDGELAARRLAAVGPATADRLGSRLRPPDLLPAEATGAALAAALAPSVAGRRVLVPRPAEGRRELVEGLAAAGAEVTAVEAYRTVPVPAARLAPLAAWIRAGEVDAVAFASPSAVRAVATALGPAAPILAGVLLGAIGPTTAEALREAKLPVGVVAEPHTGGALAEAIAERLGPSRGARPR